MGPGAVLVPDGYIPVQVPTASNTSVAKKNLVLCLCISGMTTGMGVMWMQHVFSVTSVFSVATCWGRSTTSGSGRIDPPRSSDCVCASELLLHYAFLFHIMYYVIYIYICIKSLYTTLHLARSGGCIASRGFLSYFTSSSLSPEVGQGSGFCIAPTLQPFRACPYVYETMPLPSTATMLCGRAGAVCALR